jgi:hypothetical protein
MRLLAGDYRNLEDVRHRISLNTYQNRLLWAVGSRRPRSTMTPIRRDHHVGRGADHTVAAGRIRDPPMWMDGERVIFLYPISTTFVRNRTSEKIVESPGPPCCLFSDASHDGNMTTGRARQESAE